MNRLFVKSMIAGAAIAARRIVKFDGAGAPIQSAASDDLHIGVSDQIGDIAAGDKVDVVMSGLPQITSGAPIAAGQSFTSDADGKAVPAAAGQIAIGWAFNDAPLADDIFNGFICRHTAA